MTGKITTIDVDSAGQTVAAVIRSMQPGLTWSNARQIVLSRRFQLNGELCLDPARRVKIGDAIEILEHSARRPAAVTAKIELRHLDVHVVVVEKPAGISTVRHPAERNWTRERRAMSPTLEDRVHKAIADKTGVPSHKVARLRKVHRLDKLTSGLLVFAQTALAERELGRQFRTHTVVRRYQALVHGRMKPQTIRSRLVRDRGDGRRGSTRDETQGKLAVTHVERVVPIGAYSLIECRLETGRTHQIRIHLAELGHPVFGDPVYGSRTAGESTAGRMASHAAELGFEHPATKVQLHWSMPLPRDVQALIDSLAPNRGETKR